MEAPSPQVHTVELFYDGDCAFCQACARFITRFDTKKRIELHPLQNSPHARPDGCYESILFIKDGVQHQYSSAVVAALMTMGGVWWLLGLLTWLIPRPLRDALYRFVGRRRHWFGGSRPVC